MLFKLWKRKGGKKFTFSKRGVAGKTTVENDKVGNTQRRGTPRRGNGGEGRREGAPEKSGARVWERERKKDPRAEWGREMRKRWPFGRLSRARAYPAMIHGGVPLPRHDPRRGPRQHTGPCSGHVAGSTPPPCMAGFSDFAPPCMVAGPNGLDLNFFWEAA